MSDDFIRVVEGSELYKKWNIHDVDFVRLILRFHFHERLRAYDVFGRPIPANVSRESAEIIADSSVLLDAGSKTTDDHLNVYTEIRGMFEHWRFHAEDVAALEREIPNLSVGNSIPSAPQSKLGLGQEIFPQLAGNAFSSVPKLEDSIKKRYPETPAEKRWHKVISMAISIKDKKTAFTCADIAEYILAEPKLNKALVSYGFKKIPTKNTIIGHLERAHISKPGPQNR